MNFEGLKIALQTMNTNVSEASEKIRMAHGLKLDNKSLADWQKEMAVAHISFNVAGQRTVQGYMSSIMSDPEYNEFAKGKLCAYEEWMNDIMSNMADVQSLIASYK